MKILHFEELTLSQNELQSLTHDEYTVLIALMAVSDELRVFQHLLAQAESSNPSTDGLKDAHRVQFFVLFRTFVAKLVEADDLINQIRTRLRKSHSKYIDQFGKSTGSLKQIRKSKYYKLSKHLRNKAANHYDFENLSQGVKKLTARGPLTVQLNKKRGNSVYSHGDAMMFFAALSSFHDHSEDIHVLYRSLGPWIEWTMDYSRLFSEVTENFFVALLGQDGIEGKWRQTHYYCEPEFTYTRHSKLPLFYFD